MATRKYDLAVKTGEYERDGQIKGRYLNVGVVLQGDDGMFILMDPAFNPAGVPRKGNRVLISMFEPKGRESQADRQRDYEGAAGGLDESEIPF